jgi:hypothetical protein
MSLRTALSELPDDRDTSAAVREVVTYFQRHAHTPLAADRVVRATGLTSSRTEPVLKALAEGGVLHCDGDPRLTECSYDPDRILALEVDRFLRVGGNTNVRLQTSVGRYRDRFGRA